ncbi:hypothetical protein OJ996_23195 [Luteolibacter sp. GHJ8]|uniref:Uncharacterized protein n=1 Tax=Luteolibacter rhizosphaerae TaxID=2989719 RepID=A0ABT3G9J1_9BACT|nr:hypothetical protein [Luteolibacter rhizosphaerae]MCW1916512.1 hypothetical protein [Luteolibacter rhizosphaerae]
MDAFPILEKSVRSCDVLQKLMQFVRCLRYRDLPKPKWDENEEASLEKEFNEVYDQLVAALSELYLVDDQAGSGPENAVISMSRYDVSICRHHNIVADSPAWHPDLVMTMHAVLQEVPAGWTFGIDATEFPPGQAHVVIQRDGTVSGWSEFGARATLGRLGFPPRLGLLWNTWCFLVNWVDDLRRRLAVRRALKAPRPECIVTKDAAKTGEQDVPPNA